MTTAQLLAKYDRPVPRYTSYPTVPAWRTPPTPDRWIDALRQTLARPQPSVGIYVHVPFCESLCTYCGCNTVITRNHDRAEPYIDLVLRELDVYSNAVPGLVAAPVRQLQVGGGTPTFLAPGALERLLRGITARIGPRGPDCEGSVEIDPRVTTDAHLEALRACDISRVSFGVQDVDPEVQRLVNRIQPVEATAALCRSARALGFASLNLDLIYGLPGQSPSSMQRLADAVLELEPDRLAVYSFARVPWIKPAQRRFTDEQIPAGAAKRALYEVMRERLLSAGYVEIGLDHFARPSDALARAVAAGTLHRNFMGYTDTGTTLLLGLGVSAISETPDCYHQNEKVLPRYEQRVRQDEVPTLRGHVLTEEDRRRRDLIASLMTRYRASVGAGDLDQVAAPLAELLADGIVRLEDDALIVPPKGRPFLRHAAALFDEFLEREPGGRPTYSTAV